MKTIKETITKEQLIASLIYFASINDDDKVSAVSNDGKQKSSITQYLNELAYAFMDKVPDDFEKQVVFYLDEKKVEE